MAKLVDVLDAKGRLIIAGSCLKDALGALQEVTQNIRFMNSLEDHELANLQDVYRRISGEVDYVDDVIKDIDRRTRKAAKKVKHT